MKINQDEKIINNIKHNVSRHKFIYDKKDNLNLIIVIKKTSDKNVIVAVLVDREESIICYEQATKSSIVDSDIFFIQPAEFILFGFVDILKIIKKNIVQDDPGMAKYIYTASVDFLIKKVGGAIRQFKLKNKKNIIKSKNNSLQVQCVEDIKNMLADVAEKIVLNGCLD